MEAETGAMWPQVKNTRSLQKLKRKEGPSSRASGRSVTLLNLDFSSVKRILDSASKTAREYISVISSHDVYGDLFRAATGNDYKWESQGFPKEMTGPKACHGPVTHSGHLYLERTGSHLP